MHLRKSVLYICTVITLAISFNANSGRYYWMVSQLDKLSSQNKSQASDIMANVPKGSVIEIPVSWTPAMCSFDKSIATYQDSINRNIASCVYLGAVRSE